MNAPDLAEAACITRAKMFDGTNIEDIADALYLCSRCPVLAQCHDWAKQQSRRGGKATATGMQGGVIGLHGVVGGRCYGDAAKVLHAWRNRKHQRTRRSIVA